MDEIGGEEARVPIVQWREDGARRRRRTTEPARVVAELSTRLGEPTALEVLRPSLEDIYLDLVAAAEAETRAQADTQTQPQPQPQTETRVDA